jgi:subtilase family serine protease
MLRRVVTTLGVVALLAATAVQAGASGRPPAHAQSPKVYSKLVCGISRSPSHAECFARVRTDANGRVLVSPTVSGYGPAQFHTGYNLPTTVVGKHIIAIVDAYSNPNVLANLNTYNAQFGLPTFPKCSKTHKTACLAVRNQNGQKSPLPAGNTGWGLEIALDVQVAHAICQNCRINLYEANSNSFANLATAVNTAAAQGAEVISNSYGAYLNDCSTQPAYNHTKVAVTVSAGDSGFGVACPANQNTVVAVGGTTLNLDQSNNYVSESVWSGTGSGCSTVISAQTWQTSASNWAAIGCGTKRGMNDVSADADPATGAAVYDTYGYSGWLVVGGTSLSAPLIGAVYALAQNVQNWNYPAQSVYLLPGSLHDVTTGGNGGSCSSHPLQCHAGTGYDLPTGIGTPNGLGGF